MHNPNFFDLLSDVMTLKKTHWRTGLTLSRCTDLAVSRVNVWTLPHATHKEVTRWQPQLAE